MFILSSPLRVPKSKTKDFILNLNNYRNAHYFTMNTAKANYKEFMKAQIEILPVMDKISIHYKLFPKTKRLTDIGNVVSIHQKFFEDALTELARIPEDTYEHVIFSTQSFGKVDKEDPRVEITIQVE